MSEIILVIRNHFMNIMRWSNEFWNSKLSTHKITLLSKHDQYSGVSSWKSLKTGNKEKNEEFDFFLLLYLFQQTYKVFIYHTPKKTRDLKKIWPGIHNDKITLHSSPMAVIGERSTIRGGADLTALSRPTPLTGGREREKMSLTVYFNKK